MIRPVRLAAAALALGALVAASAPALASSLPPLGLKAGQGSVGIGFLDLTADVAVLDRVTIGATAYSGLFWQFLSYRATWTVADGGWGKLGLLGGYSGGGFNIGAGPTALYHLSPTWESPAWPIRFRVSPMLAVSHSTSLVQDWASTRFATAQDVYIGRQQNFTLAVQPVVELIIPLGDHFELALFGNHLAGVYGRW